MNTLLPLSPALILVKRNFTDSGSNSVVANLFMMKILLIQIH